jgi:lysophospholipase L1-like esterase
VTRIGATFALIAATAVFCFAIGECATRTLHVLEAPPDLARGHPRRGYQLREGYDGVSKFGVHLQVNSVGLRGPELAVPKPAGTRRVLVLGDSITFGWGVEEPDTFARRLERSLRVELACPLDVANGGVSGYGSIHEADFFTHEGLALEPDVVLIYHVENDNEPFKPLRGRLVSALKDWIGYRSHLVNTVLYGWRLARWQAAAKKAGGDREAYRAEQRAWDRRPGTEPSLAALREIATVAKEHGIRVVLASQPNSLEDPTLDAVRNARLRELAEQTGARWVDAGPALAAHRGENLAVSAADLHPNAVAHGYIEEALRPAVRDALPCPVRVGAGS